MTISADKRSINHWIAAGFGSGWLPSAPGTWGSIASLLPAWLILEHVGTNALLIATALVTIIGCLVCYKVLPTLSGDKDPGWIVIDEWAGQWLCLAMLVPELGHSFQTLLIAFIAFRLFDIFKPWPISQTEKLGPPWWSIIADDLVAGVMGAIAVTVLFQLINN